MKTKVKICGITNIRDALWAVWAGADALGFVFYKKSHRYILPQRAKEIMSILPPGICKVGLFVNESIASVKCIASLCALDFVQLHGDESISYLKKLKDYRLIKAIRIKNQASLKNIEYIPCEILLLDSFSFEYGGAGKKFDWNLSRRIKDIKKPFIISGGLNPKNVKEAVRRFHPYAVDVSSGVESSPGKKSRIKIEEFIKNAKS